MGETTDERGWRVLAASVVGTSHRERDLPCQDAHAVRTLRDKTLLVTAADGAGSAARAAEGAALAVGKALTVIEAALATAATPALDRELRAIVEAAFRGARGAIEATAADESVPLRDFHTTLTCVVVTTEGLVAGQIGDGAVVARDGNGDLVTAMPPQRGEYANQAYFLTMDGALDRLEVVVLPRPVDGVVVTTDGLLRLGLKLPEYAPHPAFFHPLLAFAAEAEDAELAQAELIAFLDSERVCRRTDDDKTLVLAVRRSGTPARSRCVEQALGGEGGGP
jgi:hypothetical protein